MRGGLLLGTLTTVVLTCQVELSAQAPAVTTGRSGDSDSWSASFTSGLYFVPDSPFFVSPTLIADHGWLHLEGRYNYEERRTGSLWFGYNFSVGQRLTFEATPMIGGVFGSVPGVAPGYELTLSYRRLQISDTGEYVFDLKERSGSFFYAWPQLAYSVVDWLIVGFASQHTKAYHTDFDLQRGALVGIAFSHVQFTSYVFADHPRPTVVLEVVVK